MKLASLALVVAACAPGMYSSQPMMASAPAADPAQQAAEPAAEPAAAPDTRSAGQVIADIMTSQGYTCTALDTSWECTSSASPWQLYVSYVPQDGGQTTIWFDSYAERAFANPCANFNNAITDLAAPASAFTASCDDASKKFRLNTAVVYGSDLDVMGWVHNHEAQRASAAHNLRSIHALSKDAVRAIAER